MCPHRPPVVGSVPGGNGPFSCELMDKLHYGYTFKNTQKHVELRMDEITSSAPSTGVL